MGIEDCWHFADGVRKNGVHERISGDASRISGEVTDIYGDVTRLRGDVSGLKGDVTHLRGDLTGLYGDVSDLRGDVSDISGDVTGLRGDVTHLWGDVSGLKGNVTHLWGNASWIKGNVTNLRGSVSNLRGDVTNLQGEISRLRGNVTRLRGNVSGLWGNATDLATELSLKEGTMNEEQITRKLFDDAMESGDIVIHLPNDDDNDQFYTIRCTLDDFVESCRNFCTEFNDNYPDISDSTRAALTDGLTLRIGHRGDWDYETCGKYCVQLTSDGGEACSIGCDAQKALRVNDMSEEEIKTFYETTIREHAEYTAEGYLSSRDDEDEVKEFPQAEPYYEDDDSDGPRP